MATLQSGKAVQLWHYLIQNRFSKTICRIGLFSVYQSLIALVRLDSEPQVESKLCGPFFSNPFPKGEGIEKGEPIVSSDSARDLEKLTRTHDILFYLHLCVSLHLHLHQCA